MIPTEPCFVMLQLKIVLGRTCTQPIGFPLLTLASGQPHEVAGARGAGPRLRVDAARCSTRACLAVGSRPKNPDKKDKKDKKHRQKRHKRTQKDTKWRRARSVRTDEQVQKLKTWQQSPRNTPRQAKTQVKPPMSRPSEGQKTAPWFPSQTCHRSNRNR